jgi:hypothetical protein
MTWILIWLGLNFVPLFIVVMIAVIKGAKR